MVQPNEDIVFASALPYFSLSVRFGFTVSAAFVTRHVLLQPPFRFEPLAACLTVMTTVRVGLLLLLLLRAFSFVMPKVLEPGKRLAAQRANVSSGTVRGHVQLEVKASRKDHWTFPAPEGRPIGAVANRHVDLASLDAAENFSTLRTRKLGGFGLGVFVEVVFETRQGFVRGRAEFAPKCGPVSRVQVNVFVAAELDVATEDFRADVALETVL